MEGPQFSHQINLPLDVCPAPLKSWEAHPHPPLPAARGTMCKGLNLTSPLPQHCSENLFFGSKGAMGKGRWVGSCARHHQPLNQCVLFNPSCLKQLFPSGLILMPRTQRIGKKAVQGGACARG